jgi:hypothetical protein
MRGLTDHVLRCKFGFRTLAFKVLLAYVRLAVCADCFQWPQMSSAQNRPTADATDEGAPPSSALGLGCNSWSATTTEMLRYKKSPAH